MKEKVVAKNRKAHFLYEISDTYTAGMVLTGTEIKSLRAGHANLVEAYCVFINGELWVKQMNIPVYAQGTFYNHEPRRDRKLLLSKKELGKLARAVQQKGIAIVALRIFINERGYAKLVIGLGRGKRNYDKRQTLKQRDADRQLQRLKQKRY